MLKKVLLAIALLVGYFSIGQVPNGLPQRFSGKWYQFQYYASIDSGLLAPLRDTNFRPSRVGAITTRPSDSLMYRWDGRRWDLIGKGGNFGVYTAGNGLSLSGNTFRVDTATIAARNRLQKVADSLGALIAGKASGTNEINTTYGLNGGGDISANISLGADTTQLSTRAWRRKGTDSVAALLSNYTPLSRNITTGFGLTGGGNLTADRTLVTDTTNSLASKLRLYKVADSLGGVIASVTADSLVFSTRAWRQKAVDSLNGLINVRLTISDSATFSTKAYRQKAVDSLLSVFNTRVSGTTNTIAMFTGSNTVGNSALTQTSTTLTIPRKVNINLPTDTSIVGTLVGTGVNVGAQWVFKSDNNTTGGFVGIAAGEATGDMVLAVGANKKIVFGLGSAGNSRAAEFSENAFKIFQTAGGTSNWVTLGSLTGTQTWLFGSATTGSGFTLKTDAYINVNINGTAYKLALVN